MNAISPDRKERLAASAMHVGSAFAPILAPLVALAVIRDSEFIQQHAKHSLRDTLVLKGTVVLLGLVSLAYSLVALYTQYESGWQGFSIWPIVAKALIVFVLLSILETYNLFLALRDATRAYAGVWPH